MVEQTICLDRHNAYHTIYTRPFEITSYTINMSCEQVVEEIDISNGEDEIEVKFKVDDREYTGKLKTKLRDAKRDVSTSNKMIDVGGKVLDIRHIPIPEPEEDVSFKYTIMLRVRSGGKTFMKRVNVVSSLDARALTQLLIVGTNVVPSPKANQVKTEVWNEYDSKYKSFTIDFSDDIAIILYYFKNDN